ncbi:MAG TPA: hypothetical protein VKF42_11800 [Chitinivibrionales bacterium]|jgi:hypothetical protein|nr:hypothetical protein [Chitinivibrionales bacterium]
MTRAREHSEAIVNLSGSTKESNKFYSILLDASSSSVSESTYDIAERLLRGETDNARAALEHLWSLKKTMRNESEIATVGQLIQYYQKKMDVVRSKEEHIKTVSRDSRGLLEEKQRRDSEIEAVKKEIADCTDQLAELTAKLEKLRNRERELDLADVQVRKELEVNENEIVSGLYEIILSQAEGEDPVEKFTGKLKGQIADAPAKESVPVAKDAPSAQAEPVSEEYDTPAEPSTGAKDASLSDAPIDVDVFEIDKDKTSSFSFDVLRKAGGAETDGEFTEPEATLFPKSVVKTVKGRVIGEYYYDPKVSRDKRQYIYNSRFFLDRLSGALDVLTDHVDPDVQAELLQMIRDACKRVSENRTMHFPLSTSEILNEAALRGLWQNVKAGGFAEASRFCKRLSGKMEALRHNYGAMLKEQMDRHASE